MVAQYLTPKVSMAQNKYLNIYFGGSFIVGDGELYVHTPLAKKFIFKILILILIIFTHVSQLSRK
jgi:hypothetical protein